MGGVSKKSSAQFAPLLELLFTFSANGCLCMKEGVLIVVELQGFTRRPIVVSAGDV